MVVPTCFKSIARQRRPQQRAVSTARRAHSATPSAFPRAIAHSSSKPWIGRRLIPSALSSSAAVLPRTPSPSTPRDPRLCLLRTLTMTARRSSAARAELKWTWMSRNLVYSSLLWIACRHGSVQPLSVCSLFEQGDEHVERGRPRGGQHPAGTVFWRLELRHQQTSAEGSHIIRPGGMQPWINGFGQDNSKVTCTGCGCSVCYAYATWFRQWA